MNDGLNGNLTTQINDFDNSDPDIQSHTIKLNSNGGVIGRIYKFMIVASNYAGTIQTNALSVALASLPSKPNNPPTSISSITN